MTDTPDLSSTDPVQALARHVETQARELAALMAIQGEWSPQEAQRLAMGCALDALFDAVQWPAADRRRLRDRYLSYPRP